MDAITETRFGPWANSITGGERIARLRSMRALALVFCRSKPGFISALRRAEGSQHALEESWQLMEQLPALQRRKMLCTYSDLL